MVRKAAANGIGAVAALRYKAAVAAAAAQAEVAAAQVAHAKATVVFNAAARKEKELSGKEAAAAPNKRLKASEATVKDLRSTLDESEKQMADVSAACAALVLKYDAKAATEAETKARAEALEAELQEKMASHDKLADAIITLRKSLTEEHNDFMAKSLKKAEARLIVDSDCVAALRVQRDEASAALAVAIAEKEEVLVAKIAVEAELEEKATCIEQLRTDLLVEEGTMLCKQLQDASSEHDKAISKAIVKAKAEAEAANAQAAEAAAEAAAEKAAEMAAKKAAAVAAAKAETAAKVSALKALE